MANALIRYCTWLSTMGYNAQLTPRQLTTMKSGYDTARQHIVLPETINKNRARVVELTSGNTNAIPAREIAALDAHYQQWHTESIAAMTSYHSSAASVDKQLEPWMEAQLFIRSKKA